MTQPSWPATVSLSPRCPQGLARTSQLQVQRGGTQGQSALAQHTVDSALLQTGTRVQMQTTPCLHTFVVVSCIVASGASVAHSPARALTK